MFLEIKNKQKHCISCIICIIGFYYQMSYQIFFCASAKLTHRYNTRVNQPRIMEHLEQENRDLKDLPHDCHDGVNVSCSEPVFSNACNSSSLEDHYFRGGYLYHSRNCCSLCTQHAFQIPVGNATKLCARRLCAYICIYAGI